MAASTSITSKELIPNLAGKLAKVEFTKAGATDTIAVPAEFGDTCVWCSVVKKSTGVPDPATGISDNVVTLSVGTGVMVGLFLME